ncbi:unnamed protein product [Pylaiella littoralis]
MCDSRETAVAPRCAAANKTTRVAASSGSRRVTRSSRSRRRGLGFWLVVVLAGSSCNGNVGVRGQHQDDYDYGGGGGGGYQHQEPMRAGGGGEGGGLMKPLAAVATSFFAMKLLFSKRRKDKGGKSLDQASRCCFEMKQWNKLKKEDLQQINQQFNQMEASLTASLNEKVMQSKQLEQYLYALPDTNADGLITRFEFDKYMNEYKRSHPGLTDLDLPRFEDMDHNNNGHINFHEWEEYQLMAMNAMA